jgi:hypothetical protein
MSNCDCRALLELVETRKGGGTIEGDSGMGGGMVLDSVGSIGRGFMFDVEVRIRERLREGGGERGVATSFSISTHVAKFPSSSSSHSSKISSGIVMIEVLGPFSGRVWCWIGDGSRVSAFLSE